MFEKKTKKISDKVKEVQSTFDVGDFKHPAITYSKSNNDETNQMKLLIGL